MSQDDNPKFSHIIVGGAQKDKTSRVDDEEVIAIGAVDNQVKAFEADLEAEPRVEAIVVEPADALPKELGSEESSKGEDGIHAPKRDLSSAEMQEIEEELGGPMPLLQKIVIIACAIGLVIGIILVAWFWLFRH